MQELLTVQQFADAAGISKQAVYKALNNHLKPFLQIVDGKKMLSPEGLEKIYGLSVDQPLTNRVNPLNLTLQMLQKELDEKNKQIASLQEQNKQLTTALENTTASLHAAQALHAGTMQQQLEAAPAEVETAVTVDQDSADTEQEKKKNMTVIDRLKAVFSKNKE